MNKVSTTKLPILDGVELKAATFRDKSFPLHFHHDWSLAYIETGSEHIAFNEMEILLNRQALILIPPHALHKNWGTAYNTWTYKALYLNADTLRYVAKKLDVDYERLENLPYHVCYLDGKFPISQTSILETLEGLIAKTALQEPQMGTSPKEKGDFTELLAYLSRNYKSKVTLDSLEKEFKINKFKLLKKFRQAIGLSPLEYQTSMRIEASKQLFYQNIPLVHIALEAGFYDQSHFSHCFKKYVGVTPGAYKSNSNILQDF